jgi:pyridoxine 4-dehydrogenase
MQTAPGTWTLGDLTVNRIGFGTMRLPQTGAALRADATPRSREDAINVLRRAVDLGVNHIDTAAFYFSPTRSANELVNAALAPYAKDLVIATKVGPYRDLTGEWGDAATPERLRGHVEENLRQLGRDHLDVVYLRNMRWESIADHFGALSDLRDAGLIRHLGVSGVNVAQLVEAQAIAPVVSVQNMYGLGARTETADEVLKLCGEQGIAFVPFFAIAGKQAATGTAADADAVVLEVAKAHDATPSQIRLAWTLHQGPHVLAIPGTGDLGHLAENIAAGALRLTDDELARLDQLG